MLLSPKPSAVSRIAAVPIPEEQPLQGSGMPPNPPLMSPEPNTTMTARSSSRRRSGAGVPPTTSRSSHPPKSSSSGAAASPASRLERLRARQQLLRANTRKKLAESRKMLNSTTVGGSAVGGGGGGGYVTSLSSTPSAATARSTGSAGSDNATVSTTTTDASKAPAGTGVAAGSTTTAATTTSTDPSATISIAADPSQKHNVDLILRENAALRQQLTHATDERKRLENELEETRDDLDSARHELSVARRKLERFQATANSNGSGSGTAAVATSSTSASGGRPPRAPSTPGDDGDDEREDIDDDEDDDDFQFSALELELQEVKNMLNGAIYEAEAREQLLEESERDFEDTHELNINLSNHMDELSKKNKQLEEQNKKLTEKLNSSHHNVIGDGGPKVQEHTQRSSQVVPSTKLSELERELEEAKERAARADAMEEQLKQSEKTIADTRLLNESLSEHVQSLHEKNKELERTNHDLVSKLKGDETDRDPTEYDDDDDEEDRTDEILTRSSMVMTNTKLQELSMRNLNMEMELDDVKDKLAQTEEELENSVRDFTNTHILNENLSEHVSALKEKNKELEDANNELTHRLTEYELGLVGGDKSDLEHEREMQRVNNVIASTKMRELSLRNITIEMELDEVKDKLEEAERREEAFESSFADFESTNMLNETMSEHVKLLSDQNKELELANEELTKKLNTYEQRGEKNPASLATINVERQMQKGTTTMMNTQLAELRFRNAQVEQELEATKMKLQEAEERADFLGDLELDYEATLTDNMNLAGHVTILRDKNKELETTNQELQDKLDNSSQHSSKSGGRPPSKAELQMERQTNKSAMTIIRTKLAEYSLRNADMEREMNEMREELTRAEEREQHFHNMERDFESTRVLNVNLSEHVSELQRKIKRIEDRNKTLVQKVRDVENGKAEADMEALKAEHEAQRHSMVMTNTKLQEISLRNVAMEMELDEVKDKLLQREEEFANSAREFETTNVLNEHLSEHMSMLRDKNKELEAENEKLRQAIFQPNDQHGVVTSGAGAGGATVTTSGDGELSVLDLAMERQMQRSEAAMTNTKLQEVSLRNIAMELELDEIKDKLLQTEEELANSAREFETTNLMNDNLTEHLDELRRKNKELEQENKMLTGRSQAKKKKNNDDAHDDDDDDNNNEGRHDDELQLQMQRSAMSMANTKLQEMSMRNLTMEIELDEVKDQLNQTEEKFAVSKREYETTYALNTNMSGHMAQLRQRNRDLEIENTSLKNKLLQVENSKEKKSDAQIERQMQRSQMAMVSTKLAELTLRNADMERELEEVLEKLIDSEERELKLESNAREMDNTRLLNVNLSEHVTKLNQKVRDLEMANSDLYEQLKQGIFQNDTGVDNRTADDDTSTAEVEDQVRRNSLIMANTRLQEVSMRNLTIEMELDEAREKLAKTEDELAASTRSLDTTSVMNDNLNDNLKKMNKRNAKLERANEELLQRISVLEQVQGELHASSTGLVDHNLQAELLEHQMQADIRELEFESNMLKTNSKISQISMEKIAVEMELHTMKDKLVRTEQELESSSRQAETTQVWNETLNQHMAEIRRRNQELEEANRELADKIEANKRFGSRNKNKNKNYAAGDDDGDGDVDDTVFSDDLQAELLEKQMQADMLQLELESTKLKTKTELSQMSMQKSAMELELDNIKTKLSKTEERLEFRTAHLRDKTKTANTAQAMNLDLSGHVAKISKRNEELEAENFENSTRAFTDDVQAELLEKQMQADMLQLELESTKLKTKTELSQMSMQKAAMEFELDNVKSKLSKTEERLEIRTERLQNKTKSANSAQVWNENISEHMEGVRRRNEELEAENKELAKKIAAVEEREEGDEELDMDVLERSMRASMAVSNTKLQEMSLRNLAVEMELDDMREKLTETEERFADSAREIETTNVLNEHLSEHMEKLNQQNRQLEAENKRFKEKLAAYDEGEMTAKSDVQERELRGALAMNRTKMQEMSMRNLTMEMELEDAKGMVDKLEDSVRELENTNILNDHLSEHVENLNKQNQELEAEYQKAKEKLAAYEDGEMTVQSDVHELELRGSLTMNKTKLQEMSMRNLTMEIELEDAKEKVDELEASVRELENTNILNDHLSEHVENLNKQNQELESEYQKAKEKLAAYEDGEVTVQSDVHERQLRGALAMNTTKMQELSMRNLTMEIDLEDAKEKVEELQERFAESAREIETTNLINEHLSEHMDKINQQNQDLEAENQRVKERLAAFEDGEMTVQSDVQERQLRGSLAMNKTKMQELSMRNLTMELELEDAKEKLEKLEDSVRDLESTNALNETMSEHMSELRDKNVELELKYKELTEHLASMEQGEVASKSDVTERELRSSMVMAKTQMQELSMRNLTIEVELEEAKEKLEHYEDSIRDLESTNELNEALSEHMANVREKNEELERANKELTEKLQKLENGKKSKRSSSSSPQSKMEMEQQVQRSSQAMTNTKLAELKFRNSVMEKELEEVKEMLQAALSEAEARDELLAACEEDLESTRLLNVNLSEHARLLNEKIKDLEYDNEELRKELNLYRRGKKGPSDKNSGNGRKSEVEIQHQTQRSAMAIMSTQLAEMSLRKEAMERELDEVRQMLDTAMIDMDDDGELDHGL